MAKRWWGIQQRLFLAIILALLPLGINAVWSYAERSQERREPVLINLRVFASSLLDAATDWRSDVSWAADTMAAILDANITDEGLDLESFHASAVRVVDTSASIVRRVSLFDPSSHLIAAIPPMGSTVDSPWVDAFFQSDEGLVHRSVGPDSSRDGGVGPYALMIEPRYESLVQTVFTRLPADEALLLSSVQENYTLIFERDADGPVVTRVSPAVVRQANGEFRHPLNQELYVGVTVSGQAPLLLSPGWTLTAARPLTGVLRAMQQARLREVSLFVVASLVALVMAGLAARRFTEPIRLLTQASERMSHGELHDLVIPRTNDEFDVLGQALKKAARDLDGLIKSSRNRAHEAAFLLDKTRQQARQLEQALARNVGAQEEERRRLAREIHDWINDHLVEVSYRLQWLRNTVRKQNPDGEMIGEIEQVDAALAAGNRELRRIMNDLHPHLLHDLGLAAACRSHLHNFQRRTGIECVVDIKGPVDELDPHHQLILFRILQEAVANIEKHAEATCADVELHASNDMVRLCVANDGPGFEVPAEGSAGLGLTAMRERAGAVGGSLKIESAPNRGTIVECIIPLTISKEESEGGDESDSTAVG